MDAAQRIALHQVAVLGCDLGNFVLADERVPADERRRCERAFPTGAPAVVGIAPQRIVVSVGDGDVPERVLVGPEVVRRLRMGLRHSDAGA